MISKFKKVIDSVWARSKAFRITAIITFFVLVIALAFLLAAYILVHVYYRLMLGIILCILAVVAYKKGYGKQFSPKARRLLCVVSGGLFTGFAIMTIWRVLSGPLPLYSFLLFLVLIAVGAYVSDRAGRRFGWY